MPRGSRACCAYQTRRPAAPLSSCLRRQGACAISVCRVLPRLYRASCRAPLGSVKCKNTGFNFTFPRAGKSRSSPHTENLVWWRPRPSAPPSVALNHPDLLHRLREAAMHIPKAVICSGTLGPHVSEAGQAPRHGQSALSRSTPPCTRPPPLQMPTCGPGLCFDASGGQGNWAQRVQSTRSRSGARWRHGALPF